MTLSRTEDDGEAASTCTGDLAVRGVASKRGQPQRFRADAVGVNRCGFLGQSHGCAMSIAYAVRRPERVSKLILIGGSVWCECHGRISGPSDEQS